jgi:hypothetical protein
LKVKDTVVVVVVLLVNGVEVVNCHVYIVNGLEDEVVVVVVVVVEYDRVTVHVNWVSYYILLLRFHY